MKKLSAMIVAIATTASYAQNPTAPDKSRIMAPGMWHKISDGEPIDDTNINESAYIVLDDNHQGRASFQLALIPGDDVMKNLKAFQNVTGITAGKGQAVFNVDSSEVDQWTPPEASGGEYFTPNKIEKSREGLMICLFSGALKGKPDEKPSPHCHAMLAGYDEAPIGGELTGGFPAVGGHFGGAKVHVALEMHVDSYPEVLEKTSGGTKLGGNVLGISAKQAAAARKLLENKRK